eukprot:CAMPEP_0114256910 /NCGR_PEP_ID=MMETSP0058-20121206/18434_1 /TAXON_ID=36894 /ORGANISM="Pyramimonas parkeae, CCMP726" /LENGTH=322 /DNA_ID=CAMNT_0001371567 /DNA_START=34 /DNA_END=1001 /DNA_ORIENTATION=+
MAEGDATPLSEAEAALYDRQIRVWGVDTQQRLGSARVLFVGCSGVTAEAAKNMVLAGIGSVTLIDDRPVGQSEPGNFLVHFNADPALSVAAASAAVLSEMNPMVKVQALPGPAADLASYQVVVLTGASFLEQLDMNKRCREAGVKFVATKVYSECGHFFMDLLDHSYTVQPPKKTEEGDLPPLEHHNLQFVPLQESMDPRQWRVYLGESAAVYLALSVLAQAERELKRDLRGEDVDFVVATKTRLASDAGAKGEMLPNDMLEAMLISTMENPAVSAIVGGFLGQELMKVVSAKNAPLQNFFLFDLSSGNGQVENMKELAIPS